MLVGSQFPGLPPGLVMSMPMTSHGETSLVTSTAPTSREREERSPYRGMERDRSSSTPTSRSSPHSRLSTTESHERLQRLKEAEKESRHSPVMFQEERVRNRSVTSEQNLSPKSNRASELKGEDSSARAHPSIISNNLAVSRLTAGHIDALTEEEFIRQQRLAADPRMGYYMPPALMRTLDPAYGELLYVTEWCILSCVVDAWKQFPGARKNGAREGDTLPLPSRVSFAPISSRTQAPVVETLDSAIRRINNYPADKYYGN